jgi:hypothetical protein
LGLHGNPQRRAFHAFLYSASFDDFNDLVRAPALGAVMWGCMPAVGVLELLFACTMAEPLLVRLRLLVKVTQVLCSRSQE